MIYYVSFYCIVKIKFISARIIFVRRRVKLFAIKWFTVNDICKFIAKIPTEGQIYKSPKIIYSGRENRIFVTTYSLEFNSSAAKEIQG